jgi:hypothetical protein
LIPLEDVRININTNKISRKWYKTILILFVFKNNKLLNICRILHHLYRAK